MQTTALASGFPERPSNDHLITDTKSCAKQREIFENAEAHARTVWLRRHLPGWWCITDTQGFKCQNSHTHLPNYCTSPKEKNQYSSYPNTNSTAEFFRPLIVLHLCIFHDCMFLFCDANFHPAVHGKPSVMVALLVEHIAFLPLIRTPGVFSCSSTSFVCVIQNCLTVWHVTVSHHEWMHSEHALMYGRTAKDT